MRKTPPRHWQATFFTMGGRGFEITLKVRSWYQPRLRRQLALSFFKTIRPWLEWASRIQISHNDWQMDEHRDESRGVRDDKGVSFENPNFRLGFQIRTARLTREYTLRQLSTASGVAISEISLIERGLVEPRPTTVQRLAQALKADIPLPRYVPRGRPPRRNWWRSPR